MKLVKNSKQPIPRESYGSSNVCFGTFYTQNFSVCHRVGVDGMFESNLGMLIATSTIYSILLGLESPSIIRYAFLSPTYSKLSVPCKNIYILVSAPFLLITPFILCLCSKNDGGQLQP
jgi:hypothetical protein